MKYRLGLDMGTNSIGWAVIGLADGDAPEAERLLDMGVRIFSDGRNPQTGESLAVGRRGPRGMRRNRDRKLLRKQRLMALLIKHGLMPTDAAARKLLENIDPYTIRKEALDKTVPLYHFGRALFHLNERRGFQSNRKAGKNEKEDGAVAKASTELQQNLEQSGARTYGEWLALRHAKREPVRIRGHQEKNKMAYDFYPLRDMLKVEFAALWAKQQACWPKELNETIKDELSRCIFFQRNLKPVIAGKCSLDRTTTRGERALPSLQLCRIYQEVNALRLKNGPFDKGAPLTLEQRDILVAKLREKNLTFDQARVALKLSSDIRFSLESERRKELAGDETAILLAKKTLWGPTWHKLTTLQQDEIVLKLLREEDEDSLLDWLTDKYGLSDEQALDISAVPLKEQRQRISLETARKLLVPLQADVTLYSDAVPLAKLGHHSYSETGEIMDKLPYYGKILEDYLLPDPEEKLQGFGEKGTGRIANPTVHIALNQLRHVVNAIIKKYGRPSEIVVELLRELKQSQEEKSRINKEQSENQKKNDARRKILADLGIHDTYNNRLRVRLWEELGEDPLARCCPYTGAQIPVHELFSGKFELEHILPFSRTLDDSPANKTLSSLAANRSKGNRTPWEAMESGNTSFSQDQLEMAASYLPRNKGWRLGPDAMERYKKQDGADFIARQLTDTAYLARVTRTYLKILLENKNAIWVTPGRLTALLRHGWGLNTLLGDEKKNRTDHRHHAIDAVVIALTDRHTLNMAAKVNARQDDGAVYKLDFPEPFAGLRGQVEEKIAKIVVSHRPDHGLGGALFTETNYGVAEEGILITRKPVSALTLKNIIGQKALEICDKATGSELIALANAAENDDKVFAVSLAQWSLRTGVRRLRVKIKNSAYVEIRDRKTAQPYKALIPAEQHHLDIFVDAAGAWKARYVNLLDAQRNPVEVASNIALRLHKSDLLQIEDSTGARRIMCVKGLNPSLNNITMIEHTQAGKAGDDFKLENWSISKLQSHKAIRLVVDPLGQTIKAAAPRR